MKNSDKILAIIAIGIAFFAAYFVVDMAYGEEEHGFYGLADIFNDPNSKVKLYKSGGFSLKNYDIGMAVFAHPIEKSNMYKFFVMYDGQVSRFLVSDEVIPGNESVNSTRTEPKSSVGADITKYDIPTVGRSDKTIVIPEEKWNEDALDIIIQSPSNVQYKQDFIFSLTAIDTQILSEKDQRLGEVIVNASIFNPIGEKIDSWVGNTTQFGYFEEKIYILDNQMVGQYTLEVTLEKEKFNPISKMVSFFVIPIDDNGSFKSCPTLYTYNATFGMCVEICVKHMHLNATAQCVEKWPLMDFTDEVKEDDEGGD